jgi:hypothetical protein
VTDVGRRFAMASSGVKLGATDRGNGVDAGRAIAVLCFRAGDGAFALPADDVRALAAVSPGQPHLAALLALDSDADGTATRTLVLADGEASGELRVDGPLRLVELGPEHIVPGPILSAGGAVIGFARLDGELVQLLDARELLRTMRESESTL